MNTPKVVSISAKCNDLFTARLDDGRSYQGYVPSFLNGASEDYIELEIELETGRILNWEAPTEEELSEFK